MIRVKRLDEPSVLAEKKAEWQSKYDASAKRRPESKQYAHPQIVARLRTMSHGKCFYCEASGKMTVDHYIEVAERRDLTFAWENLYLACPDCQGKKLPNKTIPASDCVDPCDEATDPADHLTFDAESISWRTPRGEQTVKKYQLNRELLDLERARSLRAFCDEVIGLTRTKSLKEIGPAERERLLRYGRGDAPFSSMFRAHFERHGLLRDA